MKPPAWACCLGMVEGMGWRWLLCLGLALGLSGPLHADEQEAPHRPALELREAQATVVVDGHTERRKLTLPYHWDRHHPGRAGRAT
ncbi:MAG: hypothetical protein EPO42_14645, partial [Gallionellaceae bacterium]